MNGLYVAAWVVLILAAVKYIPKALRYDRWAFNIDNLDDEELAAALAEFPDLLDWRAQK
jgi:hypothetical protein